MKPNVDLTRNRDFRDSRNTVLNLNRIKITTFSKYPWSNKDHLNDDYSVPENEIILTGDKTVRHEKREFLESIDQCHCQRCGIRINVMPWKNRNDLCDICQNDLDQEYEKSFPWEDDGIWLELNNTLFI